MDKLISVIIPVYNVEAYLDRCVQSVLHQTLRELEIILVDDGSPDGCPALCDAYAKQDERVRVIHKRNGGLASARNAGLREAAGEYIFFLDSDDWLELDGLERLYAAAQEYDVDFVRFRLTRSYWPGLGDHVPAMLEPVREMRAGLYSREQIAEEVFPRLIATNQLTMGPIVGACASLYRTAFLREHGLMFDEQVKFSEDMIFSAKVVLHAKNFYYIDDACVYHYFYNPASISKSFRAERWISCRHLIELFEKDFSGLEAYDFSPQFAYLRWFCIMLGLGERRRIEDKKQRREYCRAILRDPVVGETELALSRMDVSWKQKLMMVLIKLGLSDIVAGL